MSGTNGRRLLAGAALIALAAVGVTTARRDHRVPDRPRSREIPLEEALGFAYGEDVRLPPELPAARITCARRDIDGRWVLAGGGVVALCDVDSARALSVPHSAGAIPSWAGEPDIGPDGTIFIPFADRIERFSPDGARLSAHPLPPTARAGALSVLDRRRFALCGTDEGRWLMSVHPGARGYFETSIPAALAKRFRARIDVDGHGTAWAIHPARYTLFGLAADGREIVARGASPLYKAPRTFHGTATPRSVARWLERAWVLENVVASDAGPVISILVEKRERWIEIHGDGERVVRARTDPRRLVGRDAGRRLAFVTDGEGGATIRLELYEPRRVDMEPAGMNGSGVHLFVFVSSHDCPACLSVLDDVDRIRREYAPGRLTAEAVVGTRQAARIVRIEAPMLPILRDRRDETRRRLGVGVGPALRLMDADGRVLFSLDGAPAEVAGPLLRQAVAKHCPRRAPP